MNIEYTEQEVIGDTRHDYGGFPKSIPKGAIINERETDYDGSESINAYVVISKVVDITKYLMHVKEKSEIPANRNRPERPKYAQWYRLDINKMAADNLIQKRDYFEFPKYPS